MSSKLKTSFFRRLNKKIINLKIFYEIKILKADLLIITTINNNRKKWVKNTRVLISSFGIGIIRIFTGILKIINLALVLESLIKNFIETQKTN